MIMLVFMKVLFRFFLFFLISGYALPLAAHPHAWVSFKTSIIVNEKGEATAIREHWLFDKLYSVYALQDFDPNKNGKVDPEELVQLAEENVSNLKEFGYFTVVEDADGKKVPLGDHKDIKSYFEEKNPEEKQHSVKKEDKPKPKITDLGGGVTRVTQEIYLDGKSTPSDVRQIVMEFTVPLTVPQGLYGKGFTYRIYDSTYYIDMGHYAKDAIHFISEKDGSELKNCQSKIEQPKVDDKLIFQAYSLDQNAKAPHEFGYYFSEKAYLTCQQPKS